MSDYMTDHMSRRQCLKVASSRMKDCDCLANYAGFHEGDPVWLYCPTRSMM
jgi:hypothetical protein